MPSRTLIHTTTLPILRWALLSSLVVTGPSLAIAGNSTHVREGLNHQVADSAKLVQGVREATRQFIDVNVAMAAGYAPFLGCVTGPDHGAMGIHYVNGVLFGDGEIDAAHPEALIYEPLGFQRRLVGVEYIVDAATWLANHNNTPPVLENQVFQYVGSPNHFNIDAFFELHVWAWRDNPNGAFVDWNNDVSCEGQ